MITFTVSPSDTHLQGRINNMNEIKEQRNKDFRGNSLKSRIRFSAVLMPEEIRHITTQKGEEEFHYAQLKDRYGATFFVYDLSLLKGVEVLCAYTISGQVNVAKGGVFLQIDRVSSFSGGDSYRTEG
jgi:hypothetical protein